MHKAVYIYSDAGDFIGYGAIREGSLKLQSTNIWTEPEADQFFARLGELNEGDEIRNHWPDARDPEVLALTENPDWEPIEHVQHEVLDEDHSYLVWIKVQELDENGEESGREIDGPELDEAASVVHYKTILAPARQSDVGARVHKAQELIARQRSILAC